MRSTPLVEKAYFIDDDEATLFYNKTLAEQFILAKEITGFSRAFEAVKQLETIEKEDFPELIFVDLDMPSMTGHDFTKVISQMKGYNPNRTNLIILTTSRDINDVIRSDENQVQYYYWKPLTEDLLQQIVKEVLKAEL
jgi:CheY-like chemotaxis protein